MTMIIANVLWMEKYQGDRHTLRNGSSRLEGIHLIENSGEVYNFTEESGVCRGYVMLSVGGHTFPNLNLSRIDRTISQQKGSIRGVCVVWTAPHPGHNSRRVVVGVYKNATVYRAPQIAEGRDVPDPMYYFQAKARDCILVPHEERDFWVMTSQKARAENIPGTWPGMSAVFYPGPNPELIADLSAYVDRISEARVRHRQAAGNDVLPGRGTEATDDLEEMEERLSREVQAALNDSDATLKARLARAPAKPNRIAVTTYTFQRNPDVIASVLRRSRGRCGACKRKGPFISEATQRPYLEVHHRIPLSAGGDDTVQNALALCPNCHRQEHHGPARWPWNRRRKGTR